MNEWFLYPVLTAPMPFQMELDRILFEQCRFGDSNLRFPILRFYFSSEPWISVGYSHQNFQPKENIPFCVRPTGGGVVYHGEDLIFSVIARKTAHESFGSVRASYVKIHEVIQAAFEQLGEKARFYSTQTELPRGRECFDFPIESDLAVAGRKVAGGSQKRSVGIMLHQESIQPLGKNPNELIRAIEDQFQKILGVRLTQTDWPKELLAAAEEAGCQSTSKGTGH